MGNDWYTANIEVEIMPDQLIPDYCDVDAFVTRKISGKELIIEQVVYELYQYFEKEYNPASLKVSVKTDNAAHSAVVVTKSKKRKGKTPKER